MKELKIHSKEKNNLLSIKPIDDNYLDKNYLISIIRSLFTLTKGCFYVEVSRPNFDTSYLALELQSILDRDSGFRYTAFEILFYSKHINEELLKVLSVLWFSYEHVSFCFLKKSESEIDLKRKSWYEITEKFESYVLFKGVEEDVIWIGKNKKLKFDLETIETD